MANAATEVVTVMLGDAVDDGASVVLEKGHSPNNTFDPSA
jgi:hypothetical protein